MTNNPSNQNNNPANFLDFFGFDLNNVSPSDYGYQQPSYYGNVNPPPYQQPNPPLYQQPFQQPF